MEFDESFSSASDQSDAEDSNFSLRTAKRKYEDVTHISVASIRPPVVTEKATTTKIPEASLFLGDPDDETVRLVPHNANESLRSRFMSTT